MLLVVLRSTTLKGIIIILLRIKYACFLTTSLILGMWLFLVFLSSKCWSQCPWPCILGYHYLWHDPCDIFTYAKSHIALYILYSATGIYVSYWFSSHCVGVARGFHSLGEASFPGTLLQPCAKGLILTTAWEPPSRGRAWPGARIQVPAPTSSSHSVFLSSVITRMKWADSRGQDPPRTGLLLNSPRLRVVKKTALQIPHPLAQRFCDSR